MLLRGKAFFDGLEQHQTAAAHRGQVAGVEDEGAEVDTLDAEEVGGGHGTTDHGFVHLRAGESVLVGGCWGTGRLGSLRALTYPGRAEDSERTQVVGCRALNGVKDREDRSPGPGR